LLIFSGNENAFKIALGYFSNPLIFIPQMTFHFWFLYYLIIITTTSILIALAFKRLPKVSSHISKSFNWAIEKPIFRVLIFASLTCGIYFFMGIDQVETSMSLIPDLNTFTFYFFFYITGWVLFKSKHLLNSMMRLDWANIILGTILLFTYIFTIQLLSFEMKIIIISTVVWLFIFGITGLFIRYGSKHSARMRYVSDASYWVYLVHFPLTGVIPGLIADWSIPATLKFVVVLAFTTTVCFITYHYFVRATFIGKFLNGRKYSRNLVDINKHENDYKLDTETIEKRGSYDKPSTAA